MSEAYLTNWSFSGNPRDGRDRFHATALREARVATEHHGLKPESPATVRFLSRLRLAFGGQSTTTEACNCPA